MEWDDMDAPKEAAEKRLAEKIRAEQLRRRSAAGDELFMALDAMVLAFGAELTRLPKLKKSVNAVLRKTR